MESPFKENALQLFGQVKGFLGEVWEVTGLDSGLDSGKPAQPAFWGDDPLDVPPVDEVSVDSKEEAPTILYSARFNPAGPCGDVKKKTAVTLDSPGFVSTTPSLLVRCIEVANVSVEVSTLRCTLKRLGGAVNQELPALFSDVVIPIQSMSDIVLCEWRALDSCGDSLAAYLPLTALDDEELTKQDSPEAFTVDLWLRLVPPAERLTEINEDVALEKLSSMVRSGKNTDDPRVRLQISKYYARASNRRFDNSDSICVPYLPADDLDKIDLAVARLLREESSLSAKVALSQLFERGSYVCSDGKREVQIELCNLLEASSPSRTRVSSRMAAQLEEVSRREDAFLSVRVGGDVFPGDLRAFLRQFAGSDAKAKCRTPGKDPVDPPPPLIVPPAHHLPVSEQGYSML